MKKRKTRIKTGHKSAQRGKVCICLLAGGKGTRLWPLSVENHSKSFVSIGNKRPLLTDSIKRLGGIADKSNIFVVVDKTQEKLARRLSAGIPPRNILVEPFGRSTASAVGLAAIELNPEDIMVVLPTDALITKAGEFRKTIKKAVSFARSTEGVLLCVGIVPTEPSSAYGYIKIKTPGANGVYQADKFIEKPKRNKAIRMVANKNFLWNAGIFVFKVKDILNAMRNDAPLLYRQLLLIKDKRADKKTAYSGMKNISIDYQIMEKAKNLFCVKSEFAWRDLGSWNSLERIFGKDSRGNICFGKIELINTRNSIVYNSSDKKLGVIGFSDAVVAV
ncbi:MAG: mannose-1-phosphate guanylyltransferase, partial [Candidatus Omnitrophica bacterium]|nr:mannose-1-phosphate guanylyltransferase [Candidatus Omnitrophota bacterium]